MRGRRSWRNGWARGRIGDDIGVDRGSSKSTDYCLAMLKAISLHLHKHKHTHTHTHTNMHTTFIRKISCRKGSQKVASLWITI